MIMKNIKRSCGETIIGEKSFVWGSRTYVMGVINATPDSFSGDGVAYDVMDAIVLAEEYESHGVDIIDVGGESTRPSSRYGGVRRVSVEEELARVMPVIESLAKVVTVPLSIDTYKAEVAREALSSGVSMVNDVWALSRDPLMSNIIIEAGVPVVLMHNQDEPVYNDLISEVIDRLYAIMDRAISEGVKEDQIVLDPGVGFGKKTEHNLEILRRLEEFDVLGRPLMVGTSRKSTIGSVLGLPLDDRVEGTAATVALAIAGGVDIVRVHDVKQMVRVARMSDSIVRGWISN